jgi:hypothetical protein
MAGREAETNRVAANDMCGRRCAVTAATAARIADGG